MELINQFLSDHLLHAIGWTIVHSLWQAAVVALIMSIFLNRYQNERSVVRYRIALSSLYITLFLSILTFCIHYFNPADYGALIGHAAGTVDISYFSGSHIIQDFTFGLVHHFDFITTMWITGMIVFALKFIGGYLLIKRYELSGEIIQDTQVHIVLNDLIDKMQISKPIQLMESALVKTPMMIGHLKPIILLPLGIINQLEINDVEAILAHELSHISRNDFLQNILQSFIEIVYYYHPAVWWMSANVRAERENCCDEEAVRLCGSAMNYAKALVKIEEMQSQGIPSLAIPMARTKNNLLNRVSRILNRPQNKSQIREKLVATLLLFSAFTIFGETNATITNHHENTGFNERMIVTEHGHVNVLVNEIEDCSQQNNPKSSNIISKVVIDVKDNHLVIDTIPKKDCNCSEVQVESNTDGHSFRLKIDNGEVKELIINGEEIEDTDRYIKLGDNGKIIKTEDGEILFKEYDSKNSDTSFKLYKFDDLDDDDILKAPFKILGEHHGILSKQKLIEELKHLKEYNGDYLEEFLDSESNNAKALENLYEGLAQNNFQRLHRFEFLDTPEPPQLPGVFKTNPHLAFPEPPTPPSVPKWIVPSHPSSPDAPKWKFEFGSKSNFFDALLYDGLIESGEENAIELTDKHLKINGEKQPTNIWKKYKKIYEKQLGHELMKGSKIKLKERTSAKSSWILG